MSAVDIDIIIAGFGIAGASAAIEAHDAGAKVLVVEKTSAGGGNCQWSGGFFYAADGPTAIDHLDAVCWGKTDRPVLEAYAAGTLEVGSWIESLGGAVRSLPSDIFSCAWTHFPGGGSDCIYRQFDSGQNPPGPALWKCLEDAVRSRGITVELDTSITDLLLEDGAVRGAVFESGGTTRSVSASAVILATGGIEYNADMRKTYLELPVEPIGHPGNTGVAVTLAQRAGGALWHMSTGLGWLAHSRPEYPAAFGIDLMFASSFLVVDEDGRRFADETGIEQARNFGRFYPRAASRPRSRAFIVFDETARLSGSLNGIGGTPNGYPWSRDNSAEVEAGWITKAGSPEELAQLIGVDPAALSATISQFDHAAATGNDPEFHRPASRLASLKAPLYALEVVPALATASGGPRRDAHSRVVTTDGDPVLGLYSVGGAGSIWGGQMTEQGGGLTDGIVFGRIAARHATAALQSAQ